MTRIALCILISLSTGGAVRAQRFEIVTVHDSLSLLILNTADHSDTLSLPYPVYQFCTADLTGDGLQEAVVGVEKPTRFYQTSDRRLFIFKNYEGHIRTLWRGSRIGKRLVDFRMSGGDIRCLMEMKGGRYAVADYTLGRFGLRFVRYLIENASESDARTAFETD